MAELKVGVDPEDFGFAADRLGRISAHFRTYVDDGRLPGWLTLVSRGGEIVYLDTYGKADMESGADVNLDTIFRFYSMTKPVTSVAAMMLFEEGRIQLRDPVAKYIPGFADTLVYRSGSTNAPVLEHQRSPMEVWHLMTHTSGLTYGFLHAHPVDAMYRNAGFEWGAPRDASLETICESWAKLPLLFQPGTEWNYSVATDVLGRVVEVASGLSLDEFFRQRIFEPLGMTDSGFHVDEDNLGRLAALYSPHPVSGRAHRNDAMGAAATTAPTFLSGGGGMVSTAADYHRFTQMLLRGGVLDGTRLLGTRTLDYMTRNHLPDGAKLSEFGRPLFSETAFDGMGFGLGFSVVEDPAATKVLCSEGEFAWGGAASTAFWVDPAEDLTAIFLTQLLPSSTHPIRPEFKQLVYQALVD